MYCHRRRTTPTMTIPGRRWLRLKRAYCDADAGSVSRRGRWRATKKVGPTPSVPTCVEQLYAEPSLQCDLLPLLLLGGPSLSKPGETGPEEEQRCGFWNLTAGRHDLTPQTKSNVIDGETSRFRSREMEQQAGNLFGAVIGNQSQELDPKTKVAHGSEDVSISVECGNTGGTDGVEKPAVEADASLIIAEMNRDGAVERRASGQNGGGRVRTVTRNECIRRAGGRALAARSDFPQRSRWLLHRGSRRPGSPRATDRQSSRRT